MCVCVVNLCCQSIHVGFKRLGLMRVRRLSTRYYCYYYGVGDSLETV